ncbi:putative quinol monooxygenase [Rhodococcus sp. NPDC058521]|uniref:putative quinol monooxygenase n=1 Tax=Rhodococcus sp. NPDC058521 TaxID=3346536 RepID=UPI00366213FE
MAELRVVATIPAKPGSEEALGGALSELAAASRREEGCIAYELFESAAQPGTFVTIETWRAKEDLDTHMKSEHMQNAVAVFGELLAGQPAIHPLTPMG